MAAVLLREPLPPPWNYGVTGDGRVFFINEESRSTTWLHPLTNHPVQSGHTAVSDLPRGWERAVTPEGAPYYIDHVSRRTVFNHPVTGESAAVDVTPERLAQPPPQPQSPSHEQRTRPPVERQKSTSKKKSGKILDRTPSAPRSQNSPVTMRGWLYKQDSSGLKAWKKRWFVVADFCLFYYKDDDESKCLGSILLPSYTVNPCTRQDGTSRKFAFKAEHENMRTYYFATETMEDMNRWIKAMSLASMLQNDPRRGRRREHAPAHGLSLEREYNRPAQSTSGGPQMGPDTQTESYRSSISSEHAQTPRNQSERARKQPWEEEAHVDPYHHSSRYRPDGQMAAPVHLDQDSLHSSTREGYDPYHHGNQQRPPSISSHHSRQPSDTSYQQPDRQRGRHSSSQPFNDSSFYQPGQLIKQKPISDLSKFDSNTDVNGPDQRQHSPQSHPYPSYTQRPLNQPDGVYNPQPRHGAHHSAMTDPNAHLGQGPSQGQMDQGQSRLSVPSLYKYEDQSMLDNTYQGSLDKFRRSTQDAMGPAGRPGSARSSLSQRDPRDSPVTGQLNQWRDRVQPSPRGGHGDGGGSLPGSQHDLPPGNWKPLKHHLPNNNNPIYENLNAAQEAAYHQQEGNMPGRPPLPAAYREQIVKELAETRTPATRHDMLAAAESMQHRKDEPLFFQYPDMHMEVYNQQQQPPQQEWRGSQGKVVPDSYVQAKREAEKAEKAERQWEESRVMDERKYPESYRQAKNKDLSPGHGYGGRGGSETDGSRFSNASQRSDPFYTTIPVGDNKAQGRTQQGSPGHQPSHSPVGAHSVPAGTHGPGGAPRPAQPHAQDITARPLTNGFDIHTIKEDPNMEESDILVTKKLERLKDHLNGHRLRLSISAGDLVGKSHEELVLLLIQLRRSQSRLEDARGWYRAQMDVGRDVEKEYKKRRLSEIELIPEPLEEEHQHYMSLRQGSTDIQTQVEISKPLVNLVDNLVTMGSLYGGDNLMLASQYKRHKLHPGQAMPPKKMIEFSRQHQEAKLTKEQEEQLRQLQEDEADLEEKLQQLYQLDRELQDHSFTVTSLQEDWELLQKALDGIKKQELEEQDSRTLDRLAQQRRTIDQELSKVRQQLADSSKLLEETAADNARVENEVILLRKKIMKGLNREASHSSPTLASESMRTKDQLETELTSIQSVIDGLSKQGARLGQAMSTLRRSMPDLTVEEEEPPKPEKVSKPGSTYAETDIDSMETRDLSSNQPMTIFKDKTSPSHTRPTSQVYPQTYRPQDQGQVGQPHISYSKSSLSTQSQPLHGQPQEVYSPRSSYSQDPPQVVHSRQSSYGQSHDPNQVVHSRQSSYGQSHDPNQVVHSRQSSYGQSHDPNQVVHSRQSSYGQSHDPNQVVHSRQSSYGQSHDPNQVVHSRQSSYSQDGQGMGQSQRPYLHESPSPAHQTNRSSLTDIRPGQFAPSYSPPGESRYLPYATSSAPSHSAPNLAQTEPQVGPSPAHRLSYSQPASVAFSEPYTRGHHHSTSLIYSEPDQDGSSAQDSDYVNIQPSGEVNPDTAPDLYSPVDINSADDNVKRFYGILPKDKPRIVTVRDVKKRENERRGREKSRRDTDEDDPEMVESEDGDQFQRNWRSQSMPRMSSIGLDGRDRGSSPPRQGPPTAMASFKPVHPSQANTASILDTNKKRQEDPKKSAAERLFPGPVSVRAPYDPASVERVRRTTDIFTPRPFSLGGTRTTGYRPVSMMNSTPNISKSDHVTQGPPSTQPITASTTRHVFTAPTSSAPSSSKPDLVRSVNTATVKPMTQSTRLNTVDTVFTGDKAHNRHRNNRERYRTISSSQPLVMESPTNSLRRQKMQSAAGDLITSKLHGSASELVQADTGKDVNFDDFTIDRVLFLPDKVDIPERYIPDSDDEVTEEEAIVRQEKSERIRKMLAAQSLQEWRENELQVHKVDTYDPRVHEELRQEKQRREALLDIRRALAREVSQKTREVAEMRRKTMSEIELRHIGENPNGPAEASSFMSLYETPTYQRHKFFA